MDQGFDDILVAYPTVQPSDLDLFCAYTKKDATLSLMADSRTHLNILSRAGGPVRSHSGGLPGHGHVLPAPGYPAPFGGEAQARSGPRRIFWLWSDMPGGFPISGWRASWAMRPRWPPSTTTCPARG